MDYAYVNGNDRKMAPSTQTEIIKNRFPKLAVVAEPKGSDDEWNAFFGKNVFLNRGKGHRIVVAEFRHLATGRDELTERVIAVHAAGSFIVQASDGRSTETPGVSERLLVDAIYSYETGLSPKRRSELAAHAAKSSPRSTAKQGRMPHKEAQPYLCKVEFTVAECCEIINAVRDAKGKKKYSVPWNEGFAYREKRAGRIDFPKRAAGPRTK